MSIDALLSQGVADLASERLRTAIGLAIEVAAERNTRLVDSSHLLYGLAAENRGVAHHVLDNFEVSASQIKERLKEGLDSGVAQNSVGFSDEIPNIVREAWESACRMRHSYLDTQHLLLGVCSRGAEAIHLLESMSVQPMDVIREVLCLMGFGPDEP